MLSRLLLAAITGSLHSFVLARVVSNDPRSPLPIRATNDGIQLAISAGSNCAPAGINFATTTITSNVNATLLNLSQYTTIVTFGDSYTTDGKSDGSTPAAAVIVGTNPKAGGRTTNGLTWIENIANDYGSHLMDYAVC